MRFSITSILALAAGATAIEAVTETVTMYTTYCPEATSIVHSGTTYSISTVSCTRIIVAQRSRPTPSTICGPHPSISQPD